MDEEIPRTSEETAWLDAPLEPIPLLRPSQIFNQLAFPSKPNPPAFLVCRQTNPFMRIDEDDERQPFLLTHSHGRGDARPHPRHDSAIEVDTDKGKKTNGLKRLLAASRNGATSVLLAIYQTIALLGKFLRYGNSRNLYFTGCFVILVPLALLSGWLETAPAVIVLLNALALGSAAFLTSALYEDLISLVPGPRIHAFFAEIFFSNIAWLCVSNFYSQAIARANELNIPTGRQLRS